MRGALSFAVVDRMPSAATACGVVNAGHAQ